MPRPPELRAVHVQADRIEPRLERATLKAFDRMSSRVPVQALAEAIDARDLRTAARIIEEIAIEDALKPTDDILSDAFVKGGKVAAREVNDE